MEVDKITKHTQQIFISDIAYLKHPLMLMGERMTKHMDIHCQTRIFNSINHDTKYKICILLQKH